MRRCLGGLLLLVLFRTGPVQAQGNKEILDLLPAQTLACLELRHPDRLAREITALIKGSALDELPKVLARLRASLPSDVRLWMIENLGLMSLFFSPESIAEAGRLGGAAVALTGFSKDGTPQVVGLIQTGDSHMVGLYLRGFLLLSTSHIVAEVEGIPLYREKDHVPRKPGDPGPEWEESGPVLAQLPGLLIVGSSVEVVRDVIRRARGKSADPSLSNVAAYRNAAALRDRPGLFAHANPELLAAQLDDLFKDRQDGSQLDWLLYKAIINPESIRSATASLALVNGSLDLRCQVQLDTRRKSPLLELLSDQPVKVSWLQVAPQETALVLTANLGKGQQFWERLMLLADGIAQANGLEGDDLPSKKVAEQEEKQQLKLGPDVLGRISGVSLILTSGGAQGAGPLRMVLALEAIDPVAARYLEETALPRLAQSEPGEARPARLEVQGLSLISLPPGGILGILGCTEVLSAGRSGSVLALGPDRDAVASSLHAATRKQGLMSQDKVASAMQELEESVFLGVGSLGILVLQGMQSLGLVTEQRFQIAPPVPRKEAPAAAPDKVVAAYSKAMAALPPLVLTIHRRPEQIHLSVRQPGLKLAAPRILDLWVEMVLSRLRNQIQEQAKEAKAAAIALPAGAPR